MKKLILGLGLSGKAAAKFFLKQGENVIAVDRVPAHITPELIDLGLIVQDEKTDLQFEDFDQLILSPGIPLTHPIVLKAIEAKLEVIGEMELALRHTKRPLIGVTGTNGKTTTVELVSHVLNEHGIKADALGNNGRPFIEEVNSEGIAVVELSSFQIETLNKARFDAIAILNITPDHLDRYPSLEAYVDAKFKLQNFIKPQGLFVLEEKTSLVYSHKTKVKSIVYRWNSPFGPFLENKSHDAENAQAAFLLTSHFGINRVQFEESLKTFKKPQHRIEYVKELKNVRFWNDSKGTNIDATLRAVESLKGPIHLIAGGVDKGFPYEAWIEPFKEKVVSLHVLGEAADKIMCELGSHFTCIKTSNLEDAVKGAYRLAQKGDEVLLSPGCASYDMFLNYADRGKQFKLIVEKLS